MAQESCQRIHGLQPCPHCSHSGGSGSPLRKAEEYDDITSTSIATPGSRMTATQPPIDPATYEIVARVGESSTQQIDGRSTAHTMPGQSLEERRKREDAVRFANASMFLEGFSVSAEEHLRADRYIAGEIDLAAFLRGG